MTTFLFWNINRKPLDQLVAQIADERSIDVIVLAECANSASVLEELDRSTPWQYIYHSNPVSRVQVFSRFLPENIESLGDYGGLTFRRLAPPVGAEILLIGAHLPSKRYMSDQEQMILSIELNRTVRDYEIQVGHRRTVIVGDLNMDPFEPGLIAARGFHTTASRRIAQRAVRQVRGENYHFFYNPMWGHFGDKNATPPGTYFYDNSAEVNFFWHMFDQVLVRPDLLSGFSFDGLEIVTSIRTTSLLLPNGRPNRRLISDHLPIWFEIALEEDVNGSE